MVAEQFLIECTLLVVPPVWIGLLFWIVCWQPVL